MPLFEKGCAPGPGRPKQKPLLEWCKTWTAESSEKFLMPIAENVRHKQQLEAIKLILAYGIGKPVETIDATHQLEGMDTNPHQAKEFLGQLISGESITSVSFSEESGDEQDIKPNALLDSERGAGECNT